MRSRYYVRDSQFAHFVTGTIVGWLPVFTSGTMCDVLVESMQFYRERKGLRITAWVILDNHFHAIMTAPDLSRVLADIKKYTARRILEVLQAGGRQWLLDQFQYLCAKHKSDSVHQVWQEGSHPQLLRSDAMIEQKRHYIHQNPVRRGLVAAPEHWRYSSAHEWLPGSQPVLQCDEWRRSWETEFRE